MRFFVSLAVVFIAVLSNAQTDVFMLDIHVVSSQKQVEFKVQLKGGETNSSFRTNAKGFLEVNSIKYNAEYELIFSREGFVTKTLQINTKKGYFEDENMRDIVKVEVNMIEALLYVDYDVVTMSPVGKIEIDSESGMLQNNEAFAAKRKKEIDLFLANAIALSKELEERLKSLLIEAKVQIDENEFKSAEMTLVQAEEISINKETVRHRKLLLEAKSRKGDEQEAISKIITVADKLLVEEDYTKSLGLFKRVIRLDPENEYAQSRIDEINMLLINMEKDNTNVIEYKTSTSEIIAKARMMQENRIERYLYR